MSGSKVEIGAITPANLQQLRVLNVATLPVRYSDKFYNELLDIYDRDYLQFAFVNGFVVGGVCARIEDHPEMASKKRLYIMTLNVLAPYRRNGIASKLLDHIVKLAEKDENIQDIYLHVQTSNQVAKSFYERHNFEDKGIINDYYKRIDPPHCFLLVRNLRQES
eukprot:gene6940-5003_t